MTKSRVLFMVLCLALLLLVSVVFADVLPGGNGNPTYYNVLMNGSPPLYKQVALYIDGRIVVGGVSFTPDDGTYRSSDGDTWTFSGGQSGTAEFNDYGPGGMGPPVTSSGTYSED